MATETYWCPGLWPWEWFRTCTRELPDPSDPCNATACTDAKARFADARSRFKNDCDGLRMLRAIIKLLEPIVNTPIWMIVVLALIAVILTLIGGFGILIAAVIWALIALYGISWLLVIVIGKMVQSIAVSLNQARIDMENALKDVIANCPDHCRGDISVPQCQLE